MLKISSIISILLLVLAANSAFSQVPSDTVLLLNGSSIVATVIDTANGVTTIKNPKGGKGNFAIENDRIFSIKNSKGEQIIYVYDTIIGNEFTIDEMRLFIKGEQDAEKGFKAPGALICNIVIGAAAGVTGYFLCPIPPFAFIALSGLPKVRIRHSTVSNLEYLKQESYLNGYERVARKKRKINSLIGGGIGLGVGLGTYFILKSSDNELIK